MDYHGETDPKKMPLYHFSGAVHIDYSTAVRANVDAQNYSVFPRYWYIDARFRCKDCGAEFLWSAEEQRAWYEEYRFFIDSQPRACRECRAKRRDALALRQEYDELVSQARSHGSPEQKQRVVEIVSELEQHWTVLPDKMLETRDLFQKQLKKLK